MKILCITNNSILISALQNTGQFDKVGVLNEILPTYHQLFKQYQIILIDGAIIPLSRIENITAGYNNAETGSDTCFFFLLPANAESDLKRQLQFFCMSKGFYPLQSDRSPEQITETILEHVRLKGKNLFTNVICYFGTHPGAGVTTLALETACKISSMSKANIGVLSLNPTNPGDLLIDRYDGVYLDEIKNALSNRLISENQLYDSMANLNPVKYLAGNRDIKSRLYYTSDEISYLIDLARNIFDLVIIDGGCQYDNALTIQTLLASEIKILITSQSHGGFKAWQRSFEQIVEPLGFSKNHFLMLINKYRDIAHFRKTKDLQNMYNISVLQEVPHIGDLGIIAEEEHCLLSRYNHKEYNRALLKLASNLINLYEIPMESTHREKRGFINRLFTKYKGAAHV